MAAEQQFNIKFVEEIEKYPLLYNFKLPEYMRKDTTEKVWGEIGNKFQITGPECKEKWKNLRSVFVRHLKPPKSGSATTQKKPYYLADYMQFAIPFIKIAGNISGNLTKTSHAITFSDEHISLLPQSQTMLPPTQQAAFESQQGQPKPKKNYRNKYETPEKEIANYFKTKLAKITESSENAEQRSNKMFLLSILSDMNKMNDKKRRVFKRRLLALVDEIMEEDIVIYK